MKEHLQVKCFILKYKAPTVIERLINNLWNTKKVK